MGPITAWQKLQESKGSGNQCYWQKGVESPKLTKESILGDRNQKQNDEIREMRMSSDNKIVGEAI